MTRAGNVLASIVAPVCDTHRLRVIRRPPVINLADDIELLAYIGTDRA